MRRIENVTLVDGQQYHPGDKIWDLGSFVATSAKGRKRNYEGLSKDVEKLPHYVDTGSSAFCLDTGDFYKYLKSTDIWYKIGKNQAAGGSGVSDYNDLNGKPQINGVTLQGNVTLEDLGIAEIMNESAGTPVGEIISYMGNTVPANYLACDGSEYNISEYQELANHFIKEFGSVNYFGGDGETTFAVPDLRGEFLRGSGKNSHTNQGSGTSVGRHQDGTGHVRVEIGADNILYSPGKGFNRVYKNQDTEYNLDTVSGRNSIQLATTDSIVQQREYYTSRPTNTSVLYCIKYKSTHSMQVEDAKIYSDQEKIVGKWIDGKVLYQKTIYLDSLPGINDDTVNGSYNKNIPTDIMDPDVIFVKEGFYVENGIVRHFPEASVSGVEYNVDCYIIGKTLVIRTLIDKSAASGYVTVCYTKK